MRKGKRSTDSAFQFVRKLVKEEMELQKEKSGMLYPRSSEQLKEVVHKLIQEKLEITLGDEDEQI